jgi:hypothetical protein
MNGPPPRSSRRPIWHGLTLCAIGLVLGFGLAAAGLPWWAALPAAVIAGETAIRLINRVAASNPKDSSYRRPSARALRNSLRDKRQLAR